MSERTYYVFCEDNCKFEGMTKEQILTAITQAVESHEISDVDTGFVTTLKEANKNGGLSFWVGTQAEYNAIATKANNRFYIITDDDEEAELNATLTQMQAQITALGGRITPLETQAAKNGVVLYDSEIPYGEDLSVTVENLSNYTLVAIKFGINWGTGYISRSTGGVFNIFGAGTQTLNSTGSMILANIAIGGSGNVITRNHCTSSSILGGAIQTPSEQSVIKIVGLM